MAKVWQRKGVGLKVFTFQDTPADLASEFRDAGISVESLSIRQRGYSQFPSLAWHVFGLCRRNKFDAILSFPFGWHSYIAWGAALAGVRAVVAHAGNYPPVGDSAGVRKLRATVAIGEMWHPQVACCSDHVRGGVAEHLGISRSRLHTVYNGIDLAKFDFRAKPPGQTQKSLRIGMVARFEPHKDQPTLIKAVHDLRSRGIDIQLDLVGDGTRRSEYEFLARQLQIDDHVRFLGLRRDIPDLLHQWDLFVFSVSPDEGLGVALIEALATGVPVIASDVGACREVLDCPAHGMLGALFPVGGADQLANTILEFRNNPDPWWDRAARARLSVQSRFSVEAMSDGYLKLLGVT
jgi:glycosyltransferase involved in cell wall biosynthesis